MSYSAGPSAAPCGARFVVRRHVSDVRCSTRRGALSGCTSRGVFWGAPGKPGGLALQDFVDVGGRNSALVLACVRKIADRGITVLSAGTDGIDGSSPAAGTIADGETLARAQALGIDPDEFMRRSDAHSFFERLGDAVITGPTGNDLRDLRILLIALIAFSASSLLSPFSEATCPYRSFALE
jgi:hypothetical protein